MVATVEVAAVHLQLVATGPPLATVVPDLTALPALTCNIFL